jgi:HK97 family phage major capsid protein
MDLELKTALDAIRAGVAAYDPRLTAMQTQLDAIDVARAGHIGGGGGGIAAKSTLELLKESDSVSAFIRDGARGKAVFRLEGKDAGDFLERKTTMTSTGQGFQATGVMPIERIPGVTQEPRQQLTIRNLLTARPTTAGIVDFLRVSSPMAIASPVAEAGLKPENALGLTSISAKIRTIATWLPVSRQIMDDLSELASFIDQTMKYYVNLAEEQEILSGDGTGEHLAGILPLATPFNPSLLSASHGWNQVDILGRGLQQLATAKELDPDWFVVNPVDWFAMRLLKDGFGRYLVQTDPQVDTLPTLFGKTVLPTTSIASGTWLIGTGNPIAIEIRDRMELVTEISSEHASYFTSNLLAVRTEKRLALVVKRPTAFLTGTFSQSPA